MSSAAKYSQLLGRLQLLEIFNVEITLINRDLESIKVIYSISDGFFYNDLNILLSENPLIELTLFTTAFRLTGAFPSI